MSIPDRMLPWLQRAMDLSYRRETTLAGNIANVDTPGYTPKDIDFKEFLRGELEAINNGTPSTAAAPSPADRPGVAPGLDGNQVDLDAEAALAASNRLFYELATEVTTRKLGLLRYAIDEGGR